MGTDVEKIGSVLGAMKILLPFFVLFFFPCISASLPEAVTVSFTTNVTTVFSKVSIPRLGTPLNIFVTTSNRSSEFQICGLRNLQPSFNPLFWNGNKNNTNGDPRNSTCQFYFKAGNNQSRDFEITNGTYWIGVHSLNSINRTTTLTLSFSGMECPVGRYGANCNYTSHLLDNNTVTTFQFDDPTKLLLGEFNTGWSFAQNFVLQAKVVNSSKASSFGVLVDYFFGDIPLNRSSLTNNATGHAILATNQTFSSTVANLPSSGDQIIAMIPQAIRRDKKRGNQEENFSVTLNVTYTLSTCPLGLFGSPCQNVTKLNITSLSEKSMKLSTPANQWEYFWIILNSTQGFNISTQRISSRDQTAPAIFLRYQQVPDQLSFDWSSQYSSVNSIRLGEHRPGAWFIGILGVGEPYGLWFSGRCIKDCSRHGQCVAEGEGFKCQCKEYYQNYDCSTYNEGAAAFENEYVVLIVIGGIIITSLVAELVLYLFFPNHGSAYDYQRVQ